MSNANRLRDALKSGKESSDKRTAMQVFVALKQNELLIRV